MPDHAPEMDPGRFDDFGSWGGSKPQTKKPVISNLIFDDECWLEAEIPKRPWIAPGYLLRGSVTILAGVPGGGKSSMAVSWATSLVLCQPFGSFEPIKACRVLTYNTEDDANEQRRRFSASLRGFGAVPPDLAGKLLRVGVERIGTLFGECHSEDALPIGFGPLPAMEELEERLRLFRPDVVILDPLVELHDRDENDNTELRRVVAEFRAIAAKYDAAVVLLHHTRKGSASAAGDADSIRGGGAIVGAGRVALTLTRMSEDDAKAYGISEANRHHYVRLDEAKANYSATAVDWFEKTVRILDNGDSVMDLTSWSPPEDVISADVKASIIAGVERGSPEGPWSTKMGHDARSIRQLFHVHGITTKKGQTSLLNEMTTSLGFTTASFRRATNRVKAQGLRSKDGLPSNVHWLDDDADE